MRFWEYFHSLLCFCKSFLNNWIASVTTAPDNRTAEIKKYMHPNISWIADLDIAKTAIPIKNDRTDRIKITVFIALGY